VPCGLPFFLAPCGFHVRAISGCRDLLILRRCPSQLHLLFFTSSIIGHMPFLSDISRVESFPRIRENPRQRAVSLGLGPALVLILCKNRGQTPLKTAVRKSKVRGFNIATGSSLLLFYVSISASVAKISSMHGTYA
ncbi:hypothetical protein ElyMa_002945000, partial [Elysia marginata]